MAETASSADAVILERTFDAPASLIWRMWTDPALFASWYGPDGATVSVVTMDVRVGGARLICMDLQTPSGPRQMWFTGEHREVVELVRLVYTESIADEQGNVLAPSAMGMPEGHPITTEVRVELGHVGGRTTMVLTHVGVPAGSPGAGGWAMALDKLEARVASPQS